jgi:hypothetical protein
MSKRHKRESLCRRNIRKTIVVLSCSRTQGHLQLQRLRLPMLNAEYVNGATVFLSKIRQTILGALPSNDFAANIEILRSWTPIPA